MDVGRHPNIRLLAYAEVEKVEGDLGDFQVTVRKKARYVEESKCTGCGACAEKCPTPISDEYNLGLAQAKAIYRYFAQGIPSTYTIDPAHCRNFQKGKKCGVCAKVCQAGAINYEQQEQIFQIPVGAIILATGYDLFDARRMPEYGYGRIPNVITALELERLLSASGPTHGHLYRPSDLALQEELPKSEKLQQKSAKALEQLEKKFEQPSDAFLAKYEAGELQGKEYDDWATQVKTQRDLIQQLQELRDKVEKIRYAKRLAFIQCVGSRDLRFNRQCSSFCCMHAIKEAIIAREHDAEVEVFLFGMDIRAVGKGFEEYRNRGGREAGIQYIRSRVAEITQDRNFNPVVWYEDTKKRETTHFTVDMVILATACEPGKGAKQLAEIAGVELNGFGFIKTDPFTPPDTTRPGVFVCGCAQGPMDIPESVAQSSSTAARVAQALGGEMRKAAAG
jgi:heterodisulfide reductase subunit A-like polyferredoxin